MFDLNEIPEHPQVQETVPGPLENDDNAKVSTNGSSSRREQGAQSSTATDAVVTPSNPRALELLLSPRRSFPPLAPVESVKRHQYEDSPLVRHQRRESEDGNEEEVAIDGAAVFGYKSNTRGVVPASSCSEVDRQDADLITDKRGMTTAYRFMGIDASNSSSRSKQEDLLEESPVDDRRNSSSTTLKHRNLVNSEAPAFGLSLGGGGGSNLHRSLSHHRQHDDPKHCSSKNSDIFDLALGRTKETPLTLKKTSDLSPFWHGKLRTDAPLLTPVVSYCLGMMKPDSRLKRLPAVLSSKKLMKMEEFQNVLRNGVAEPLIQFKPSVDASMEEIKRFNLMVEALSHGTGLTKSPSPLGLEFRSQNRSVDTSFPYSAALLTWEDINYSSDAKLYLISSLSFKEVLKNFQSKKLFGSSQECDLLDPESLYGVFCCSTSHVTTDNLGSQQSVDQDPPRAIAVSLNERSDATPSSTAGASVVGRGGTSGTSPFPAANHSRSKNHGSRSELLTKSASMEPIRSSSRDANLRYDFEETERGSKKRYHKQLSSIDIVHETDSKRHSRYPSGSGDLYEDEVVLGYPSNQKDKFSWNHGRNSQRHDFRSDRLKDSIRWSRDERDSNKNRSKEHQRHAYHEGERGWRSRGIEAENGQDRAWHKSKERYPKDNISEDVKPITDKGLSGSKSGNPNFHRRDSPDHESGKTSKKREREDEKEQMSHLKRSRESGLPPLLESDHCQRDTNCDPKLKVDIEKVHMDCLSQKDLGHSGKLTSNDLSGESHPLDQKTQPNDGRHDTVFGNSTQPRNLEIPKPGFGHVRFDGIMAEMTEVNRPSGIDSDGVSEMDTGFNLLKLPPEQDGIVEDGAPLKWGEVLHDSSCIKVDKEEKEELASEFLLDVSDKETRTWLVSKQNAVYLLEEYGVTVIINADGPGLNSGSKTDSQNSPLQVRISMTTSASCDAAEARWFLDQAACMIKSIAARGVFIKCLWYEGPVQTLSGDGAPSVPLIVKKIKGEDGKNLERMQDVTGVMIGVVLRKGGVAAHDSEPVSRPRFIGLRLKCVRRKGLLEASEKADALLESVAEYFSKELETHVATHVSDLQESPLLQTESLLMRDSPTTPAIVTKELLPSSPIKPESQSSPGSSKLDGTIRPASSHDDDPKVSDKALDIGEDADVNLPSESHEVASRPLYVSNLPENITEGKIRNIFECVLKEKLEDSGAPVDGSELVTDVRYVPDKYCAFVELANDDLLSSSLKLYGEDKNIFQGLSVELGLSPISKSDRQNSFSRNTAKNRISNNGEHTKPVISRSKGESYGRRLYDNESDSDYSQEMWYGENVSSRSDHFLDKPRPLFLSELMRNASGPTIKQLFEEIITTYIGPSLVSSNGRQLVLDVRYVPSRGCAFVDLATPELVEFMLDLHSRRPEVFLNMKMELGRRPVPYSVEDDAERRLSMRSRDGMHGKSQYGSQYAYHLTSSGSRKKLDKRASGSYNDFLEDSDKGDDIRQSARLKRLRSDPEKTIYADRLPESASEGMIRKIFERVLLQSLTREELDAFGEQLITEVRHVPSKYCAFVVFATEDLTRTVLHLYSQDEDAFDSMRLKPHFHSRMEDLYTKDEPHELDDVIHSSGSFRERATNLDVDDFVRPRAELYDPRSSRSAARAIAASAFKEVDRRRSVYVDRIPEDLSEYTMTEMFEKVFRHKKNHHDGHMVSQVAYFRDKFDPSKLCAFVELKTEDGTQDLVDFYNANPDAFEGVRVRPGFKYNN